MILRPESQDDMARLVQSDIEKANKIVALSDAEFAIYAYHHRDAIQTLASQMSQYLKMIADGTLAYIPVTVGQTVWLTDVLPNQRVEATVQKVILDNCFGDSYFEVDFSTFENGERFDRFRQYRFPAVGDTVLTKL